jgi:hypothetical protein
VALSCDDTVCCCLTDRASARATWPLAHYPWFLRSEVPFWLLVRDTAGPSQALQQRLQDRRWVTLSMSAMSRAGRDAGVKRRSSHCSTKRRHIMDADSTVPDVANGSRTPGSAPCPWKRLSTTSRVASLRNVMESMVAKNRLSSRAPVRYRSSTRPSRRSTDRVDRHLSVHRVRSSVISAICSGSGGGASPHLDSTNAGWVTAQPRELAMRMGPRRLRSQLSIRTPPISGSDLTDRASAQRLCRMSPVYRSC